MQTVRIGLQSYGTKSQNDFCCIHFKGFSKEIICCVFVNNCWEITKNNAPKLLETCFQRKIEIAMYFVGSVERSIFEFLVHPNMRSVSRQRWNLGKKNSKTNTQHLICEGGDDEYFNEKFLSKKELCLYTRQ